jgi:hypothetical protein
MPIQNQNPVTKPAENAKTYDKLWLEGFSTLAKDFSGVRVAAILRPYRTNPDTGASEFAPKDEFDPLRLDIENVYYLASEKPYVDAAIGQVLDNIAPIRAGAPTHSLALLELMAQAVGAAAQADAYLAADNSSSSSSDSSSSESSESSSSSNSSESSSSESSVSVTGSSSSSSSSDSEV